ncbi:MAG TPA: hypothetical protein PKK61_05210 [Defluviitaleaceae bacterium]|nr:hypothetical protein [Defluviitaleaceae bacterium]
MIFRILNKEKWTIKGIVRTCIEYLSIILIFVFIIYFLFYSQIYKHFAVAGYKYTTYDIVIKEVLADNYNNKTVNDCPYIDESVRVIAGLAGMEKNNKTYRVNLMLMDEDKLNAIFKITPPKLFLDYSYKLMDSRTSLAVSYELARRANLKVGDTVKVWSQEYRVAGIFDDTLINVFSSDIIMCWHSRKSEGESNDSYKFYTRVYIKLNDYEKGVQYFHENHYKEMVIYTNYNGVATPELIERYKVGAYSLRNVSYKDALDQYNRGNNTVEEIFYVTLCLIALFTICAYDSYSHAKSNEVKVGILRILGCKKHTLFFFYFIRSAIIQTLLMVFSVLFIKKFNVSHISYALIGTWMGTFLVVIIASALLSAICSMLRLRDDNLILKLAEGGI